MSNLFWLTDAQMVRLQPFFPKSHGRPRVDDRRVLSGIIFINRNGLRWRDAPKEYGPPKTLYNRWKRWSDKGIFVRMMDGLAAEAAVPKTVMIGATYLKAHRTATSLRSKKGDPGDQRGRLIGRTKGGMNTKLHAVRRCRWAPYPFLHDRRPGQRLHGGRRSPRHDLPPRWSLVHDERSAGLILIVVGFVLGKARRARSPQFAQASGALPRASGFPAMSAA